MKTKLLILLVLLTNISSSSLMFANSMQTKTETRNLQPFSSVQIDGGYEIVLIQGNEESITIEGTNERLSNLKTDVTNGKLKVYTKLEYNFSRAKLILRFKNIEELELNGGISIENEQVLKLKDLKFDISGGADVKMNVEAENVDIKLSGGTNIEIKGKSAESKFQLNGTGRIDAEQLISDKVKVEIAGAGYAIVYASKELDASIAGVGNISYVGNPQRVKSDIAGVGSIKEK